MLAFYSVVVHLILLAIYTAGVKAEVQATKSVRLYSYRKAATLVSEHD